MLINRYNPSECAQQLASLLAGALHPALLLLDGALNPDILKLLRRHQLPWFSVFAQGQSGDKTLLKASPLLLPCPDTGSPALRQLLEACNGLPMVSIWVTPERVEQLGERLHPWCVVKADDQYFNLRFPDTRRLPDIAAVLTPEQSAQLFGPASHCVYLGRDGQWQVLRHDGQNAAPAPKVELDAPQTLALIRAAEADETLHLLRRNSQLPDCTPQIQYQCLHETLNQADRAHIQAPDARYTLCQQALATL